MVSPQGFARNAVGIAQTKRTEYKRTRLIITTKEKAGRYKQKKKKLTSTALCAKTGVPSQACNFTSTYEASKLKPLSTSAFQRVRNSRCFSNRFTCAFKLCTESEDAALILVLRFLLRR